MIRPYISHIFLVFSLFILFHQTVQASDQARFLHVLHVNQLSQHEGFVAGTLVKTPDGYQPIEEIDLGMIVCACDIKNGTQTECRVLHISKMIISDGVQITCGEQIIIAGSAQRFFAQSLARWVTAQELIESITAQDTFSSKNVRIEQVSEPIEVYQLLVETNHTFYVTECDVLAHNAIPTLAMSAGFASTSAFAVVVAPVIAIAVPIAAGWIIWTALAAQIQNSKKKSNFIPSSCGGGGGGPDDPDDPEKNKNKKNEKKDDKERRKKEKDRQKNERKKVRDNYRPLTNKEARIEGKKLGYIEDKSPPFDSLNKPTFRKGNDWISPDKYGHRGGVWKRFFGRNRVGTYDQSLKNRIGD